MISKLLQLSQRKPNLIFDFDKTIAQVEIDWTDWHPGVAEIFSRYDENHGYRVGKNPHEYYNALAETHGRKLVNEVQEFVSKYEEEYTTAFSPYTELVDFIKTNQDKNMFVFSSNARNTVETGLRSLGILDLFEQLITRDDVSKVKPDTEGFDLLEGFEEDRNSYLMIGDSDSDEIAANTVGIDFLRCTYFGTYHFSE